MAAGIPDDVAPVAAHEAQAFQAFVIDGVTKQLQKDNKAERLPEFIRAAGAYGKGDLDADSFLLTLSDLFGEQKALKMAPTLARLRSSIHWLGESSIREVESDRWMR